MYEGWSYISLMEEKVKLSKILSAAEKDMKKYKSDFAILKNQEITICGIMVTANNTSENFNNFKVACNNINEMRNEKDFVPGLDTLLDFSEIQNIASNAALNSDLYYADLKLLVKEIDVLKEVVSNNIDATNKIITENESMIKYIDQKVNETYCGG